MEASAYCNDLVSEVLTKVSAFFFDNTTAFDTTNCMFYADANSGNILVEPLLQATQLAISRVLKRLNDMNVFRFKTLIAIILKHMNAIGEYYLIFICNSFIMHLTFLRRT